MDTATTASPARRRSTASFRAQIVESCLQPGAHIPVIAQAHGIRLELLRRWIRKHHTASAGAHPTHPPFLPIQLGPAPAAAGPIHIEIRRGDTHIHIHCPISATPATTDWLRECLK